MSHNKSIEKTTSATLKLSQPSTSRHELAERTTLTKKKNISANDRDHSQATKSDTNRRCSWELSIDLLVKVGPNHVHDLLWDVRKKQL